MVDDSYFVSKMVVRVIGLTDGTESRVETYGATSAVQRSCITGAVLET
jgi:hypothetical protein